MGERCSLYYQDKYVKILPGVKKSFGYFDLRNRNGKLLGIIRGVNNTPLRVSWRYMFSINWREGWRYL